MTLARLYVLATLCVTYRSCYEVDSSETNRIDIGRPGRGSYYDAIIFNDVTNMLSDIDKKGMSPFNAIVNDEDNDESAEDLLSEYQRYLEKAERQRQLYEEKKQRGKLYFTRNSFGPVYNDYGQEDFYDGSYKNVETYIPIKLKLSQNDNELKASEDDFGGPLHDINCLYKRALFSSEAIDKNKNDDKHLKLYQNEKIHKCSHTDGAQKQNRIKDSNNDTKHEPKDNALNVRVKVEVQFPNQENTQCTRQNKSSKERTEYNDKSMELKPLVKLQFPYFNYPMALAMDSDKMNGLDNGFESIQKSKKTVSANKTTIHRKKKPKPGNNKKHRKKFVTLHNLKTNFRHRIYVPISIHHNTSVNLTEKNHTSISIENDDKLKKIQQEKNISNLYLNDIFPTTAAISTTHDVQKESSLTESNATINNTNNIVEEIEAENDVVRYNSTDNIPIDQQKISRRKRSLFVHSRY